MSVALTSPFSPPDKVAGLAAAACFVLHGFLATRIALSHSLDGEVSDNWRQCLLRFVFLSAQCNILVLTYGLAWMIEICSPGSTTGLVSLSVHVVCGLSLYVFVNYYGLIHFHKEAFDGLSKVQAEGKLLFRGDIISVHFFVRTQNYMHAPLLPLAGLPLVAMDRQALVEGMMGVAATGAFALCYGVCYASLCLAVRYFNGTWIYPFMNDFTRVWHHVVFYGVSFGLYLLFCLGYRAFVESTVGLELQEGIAIAVVTVALVLAVLIGNGGETAGEHGSGRKKHDHYSPLRGDVVVAPGAHAA